MRDGARADAPLRFAPLHVRGLLDGGLTEFAAGSADHGEEGKARRPAPGGGMHSTGHPEAAHSCSPGALRGGGVLEAARVYEGALVALAGRLGWNL